MFLRRRVVYREESEEGVKADCGMKMKDANLTKPDLKAGRFLILKEAKFLY